MSEARVSPLAFGRPGDLVLDDGASELLTFANAPDLPGHRRYRGSLVDIGRDGVDRSDPLVSWRVGWTGPDGPTHAGPMSTVEETDDCPNARGIHLRGLVDGVRIDSTVCPIESGYELRTEALGLPVSARLTDEVNAGSSHVVMAGRRALSEGERDSAFLGITDESTGLLVEAGNLRIAGQAAHIGEEIVQTAFVLSYSATSLVRRLRVLKGDSLDLLAEVAGEARSIVVGIEGERSRAALLDATGKPIAVGDVSVGGRTLKLPFGVGTDLAIYDVNGVLAAKAPLDASLHRLVAAPPVRSEISFRYTDDREGALPVHVIFRGLSGTPDPEPIARGATFAAGHSLYLVDGTGSATLAPGRYRVVATHGIGYTLDVRELQVTRGEPLVISGVLRDVFPNSPWTSGDFHLHSAPSPDAPVAIDARVATLVAEGLDVAIATDHNRITDYAGSVARLGVGAALVTAPGDEISTVGPSRWGHFNLYPLAPLPAGAAPEDSVPPYFNLSPADIFAAAHAGDAARILQVNHPRMDPSIGYFDLTHLDPKSGAADPSFSQAFDAVEAFNGFWMTNPAKVSEGAHDLVALARRGVHVAAMGNSDSHHLLYEEAGYPRTYVHVPKGSTSTRLAEVLAAIRRHDTTVSSGPLVEMTVDGASIGSVVVPKRGHEVRVHVRVSAPAWVPVERVEIWHDDDVAFHADVTSVSVDGVRYETEVTLPFAVDGTVLAWATATTPLPDVLPYSNASATGFTGLAYVDADGDGKVVVPPGR